VQVKKRKKQVFSILTDYIKSPLLEDGSRMKYLLPLLILCLFLTGFTGCEKPTGPKDSPEPDTTGHNFVWRVDTLGTYVSTVRDVAIVDENNIWAVGEFYKKHSTFDSTVKDQYNAAHWNGVRWELKRVPIEVNYGIGYGGIVDTTFHPIYCVFVVNSKIIFSSGGVTLLENGRNELLRTPSFNEKAGENNFWSSKIWAKDENNIWFVGPFGTIIYFNGTAFTKIPYDESVDFVDIWGDETGVVRAVASNLTSPNPGNRSDIVELTSTGVKILWTINFPDRTKPDQPDYVYSVWWKNPGGYWVGAGDGIFRFEQGVSRKVFSLYENHNGIALELFRIKGNDDNDWFSTGNSGQITHFNGKSLWLYREVLQVEPYGEYISLSVKGNIVCAGGERWGRSFPDDQSNGLVAIGVRK